MHRAILTCSPLFPDLALNEIRRFHPSIRAARQIAPGYVLIRIPTSFEQITRPWRTRLPIYLHHMFPAQAVVRLDDPGDLSALKREVARIAAGGAPIQVRSTLDWESPYSAARIYQALGRDSTPRSLDAPAGRVVSILVTGDDASAQAYLGASMAGHNISPWAGGAAPVAECVPNRAGYKLLEALSAFSIRLRRGDHALDLGAAPGAWTTLLRRRGLQVTAVAPAPMYPWLAIDPGVEHRPMRAEDFLAQCDATYDLIVNDMKLDGQDSARLMVDYARRLRAGGIAVMTLKLRQQNRLRVMDHALRILRRGYRIIRVRQLVSNGHEVTLFLRKK